MKTIILRTLLLALVITGSNCIYPVASKAQVGVSISYQTFYDQLSPDGSWISNPDYGYVWVPNVDAGFKPYATHGHWVYTDDGWVWASSYRWGWAAFHYGRWGYDDESGWFWIPDHEWAPSWVVWGNSGDNYCWAPLGPRVSFGVSFNWNPPARYWVSCPHQYMGGNDFRNHIIVNNNVTIVRNINIIRVNNAAPVRGNVSYHPGPAPAEVGRFNHTTVHPVRIVNNNTPGSTHVANGAVSIYRPSVHADERSTRPVAIQPRENIRQNHIVNPAVRPQRPNPAQPANAQHPVNRVNPGTNPVNPAVTPNNPRPGNRMNPATNPADPATRLRPQTNPATPANNTPSPNNRRDNMERFPISKPPATTTPGTPAPVNPRDNRTRQRPVNPQQPANTPVTPTPRPVQPNNPPPQQRVPETRPVQPMIPKTPAPQPPQHMPAPKREQNPPHPPAPKPVVSPQKPPVQPPQKHDGPQQ